jgi:hypothetical protein
VAESRSRARASRAKADSNAAPSQVTQGSHVCQVAFCPIGLALSSVQQAAPDVMEHLLAAAREFFLAAKAVVDARAADLHEDATPAGLERIEIA